MLSELWCVMKGLAVAPPAIMLKIGGSICSKTDKREEGDGSGRRETKSTQAMPHASHSWVPPRVLPTSRKPSSSMNLRT